MQGQPLVGRAKHKAGEATSRVSAKEAIIVNTIIINYFGVGIIRASFYIKQQNNLFTGFVGAG